MPHPDKEKIISLVNRLLKRSGLTIDQVVARMQASGCDISRSSFENHFTTRAGRKPNIPPEYVLALITAFSGRLPNGERGTAAEAIELARLTRLPIDNFGALKQFFPTAEFITAFKQYAPPLDLTREVQQPVDLRCPYRGLQPFDEEHAEFFFGREADTEWLLTALQHSRFLAVIGPSGSGKSSLVRAGLIPALRRGVLSQTSEVLGGEFGSAHWLIRPFTPGEHPLTALINAVNGDTGRKLPNLIEALKDNGQSLHRLVLKTLVGQPDNPQLVLVVDQFEELFTLCRDESDRRAFMANLIQATTLPESRTLVILTMRADFYPQAATYSELAVYLADNQVLLSQMTETELTQAITRPAQKVGLYYEAGLVDRLLHDAAAEPGALPLLQHTLLELWERRHGRELTLAAYQSSGGVHGALARRADTLLAEFSPEQQAIVRRVMLRLTRLGENTADTRLRATLAELVRSPEETEGVRTVITRLADARLVTTSLNRETDEEIVDVAHEALIRGWPTLQDWLTEDREALRHHQQLADATLEWDRNACDESYLHRGVRLASAEEWAESHADEMNASEQEFLAASLAVRQREAAKREERQRRTRRNLTIGLVTALVALAIMTGLTLFAFNRQQRVEAQRQETLSRQLASQARELLDEQFDLALLLSVQAHQIADTVEARSSLLTALQTSPHLTEYLRGHTDWVWDVAFSPDGQTLASAGADGSIILWDVVTRQPPGPPLTGHTGWVRSLAFSPDGQILASGSADNTIRLWDVKTKEATGPPLTGHSSFVTDVAFSPDGQTLASSSADGTIILWDVADESSLPGQPLGPPLAGHTSLVLSVAFSPDGQTLASAGADQSIILWDIGQHGLQADQPLARALTGHQGDVTSVAFSPDGQTLASGSADGTIILWSPETLQPRREPLTGHKSGVNTIAFSPDGKYLISGSDDKTIMMWDVARGQPLDQPFIGHAGSVLGVALNPASENAANETGQTAGPSGIIASGSADGTIILWNLATRQAPGQSLVGHAGSVRGVAFSADGQTLASAGTDNTIRLWDLSTSPSTLLRAGLKTGVATGQPLGPPLTGHTSFVNAVAFSPDTPEGTGGQLLASASDDRTIILWNVVTRQPIGLPLTGHTAPVLSLAFSPDGQTLISNDEGANTILWDISTVSSLSEGKEHDTDATTGRPVGSPLPGKGKGLAFSSDRQTLARKLTDTIRLWNLETGQPLDSLVAQQPRQPVVRSIALGPGTLGNTSGTEGQILALGNEDGTIVLWDLRAGQPLGQPLMGHTGWIWSLAFSPAPPAGTGGQILASGSNDGTAVLWDLSTRRPLGLPLINGDRVREVVFSPDGRILATAGRNDGAIILWDVDPESWQERACQMVVRNLTPTEWERYLGDEPYRLTCSNGPPPAPAVEAETTSPTLAGVPTPTAAGVANNPGAAAAAIIEEFDSNQGFIQTSENIYIRDGLVHWHFERSGGEQYVYRSMPPFSGNVRLVVRGQVDSWTNNCNVMAGIGDGPESGLAIDFGWTGGGCPTNGVRVDALGVTLDRAEQNCEFSGNWLWIDDSKPYTAELTIVDGAATLSVEGIGSASGEVQYEGPYTTLWVGNTGRGDWPECTGTIDTVIIEPLD